MLTSLGAPLRASALLLATLLLPNAAEAQAGSRDFVCSYLWDYGSRTFFIGRQIIEVQSDHPHNSSLLYGSASTEFHRRVSGQVSRDDQVAHPGGGYSNWGLAQATVRQSLNEVKRECLKQIEEAARRGFHAYGVGDPIYTGDDEEEVRSHSFLSILEFPNYVAGTIADRKRRADRSEETDQRPQGSRDANGWAPGEYARYIAQLHERGTRMTAEADSLYDAGEYAAARAKYAYLFNIGVPEWAPFHPHARARMDQIDRITGVLAYGRFTRATGISFGAYGSQSYFDRDSHLMGLTVAKRMLGLNSFFGIATGRDGLKSISGADTEGSVGEYTQYQLMAGAPVPMLRLGPFGIHAAYIYQKTDRRALNLGMAGIHMGTFGEGPTVHFDVTQVFGQPRFGFGVDLNFSDLP